MATNLFMFETVSKFEKQIAEHYGAPFAIATDSCTHAIELCLRYKKCSKIVIPTRTYISVPFLALKLNMEWEWCEKEWEEYYYLGNTNIIDAAVYWKKDGYIPNSLMCLSFQFQKHLSLGRGGMILLDREDDMKVLKKMSYDGREPSIPWRKQNIDIVGYHYYMTPETAQTGINKLPEAINNSPKKWKWTDWPDLRTMEVFK